VKARAIKANLPIQRLIRLAIEDYLNRPVKAGRKSGKPARTRSKAA
jgi:hypothetical protein